MVSSTTQSRTSPVSNRSPDLPSRSTPRLGIPPTVSGRGFCARSSIGRAAVPKPLVAGSSPAECAPAPFLGRGRSVYAPAPGLPCFRGVGVFRSVAKRLRRPPPFGARARCGFESHQIDLPRDRGTSPDVPWLVAAALSRAGRGCTSPTNLSVSLRRKHLIRRD